MKNKYIKLAVLFLLFSVIISDSGSIFYNKSLVLSAEIPTVKNENIPDTENGNNTDTDDSDDKNENKGGEAQDKKNEKDSKKEKTEKITSGILSDTVYWNYSGTTLYFSGSGAVPSFDSAHKTLPWASYSDEITEINFSEGITGVGSYAFDGCASLIKVTATASVKSISPVAFPKKTDLTFFAPYNSYILNFAKENSYRYSATTSGRCTVYFNTLTETTFNPKTVMVGDYYGTLPTPFAKGYTFLGWYTDPVGGINITSSSTVEFEYDIYLYARWSRKQYSVKFIDNYSYVSLIEKTVSEGEEFGFLPIPSREGYVFSGWFTDISRKNQVTETTKVYASSFYQTSINLYAKWEPAQYVITFDSAGGTINGVGGINIKTVVYGGTYGTLPVPERDGYEFKGWFTAAENGNFIDYYTPVPALPYSYQTLYAHWEKIIVEEHTVIFDSNGGFLNREESIKTVAFGREYGTLPIPSRKNYSFNGWFTKKNGGKKVYGNDIFSSHSDITLYAKWTKSVKVIYTAKLLKKLSYNFSNTLEGFGYEYGYKIPLVCFQFMFGKTELANLLYKYDGYWAGNCYGMATTSGMLYSKSVIKPSAFKQGAKSPSDLKLSNKNPKQNMSLKKFIEVMQISQYFSSFQKAYNGNANKLSTIVKRVKNFQKSGKNPIVIGISGVSGAHAVVGYAVKDYADRTSRLFVYDPNFPGTKRYITLSRDSSGTYTGWYYLMSNIYNWGSAYDGMITYISSKDYTNIWKKRSNTKIASNILFTDTDNAVIYDENKKVAAVLNNGNLISENKDIQKMWDFKIHSDTNIKISLPAGVYTVKNTGKKRHFTVAMAGVSLCAKITTSANRAVIAVDEAKNICSAKPLTENNALSSLALTFKDDKIVTAHEKGTKLRTVMTLW